MRDGTKNRWPRDKHATTGISFRSPLLHWKRHHELFLLLSAFLLVIATTSLCGLRLFGWTSGYFALLGLLSWTRGCFTLLRLLSRCGTLCLGAFCTLRPLGLRTRGFRARALGLWLAFSLSGFFLAAFALRSFGA